MVVVFWLHAAVTDARNLLYLQKTDGSLFIQEPYKPASGSRLCCLLKYNSKTLYMMETGLSYNFPVHTKVYFGAGKLSLLHTLAMPGSKALLVISNGRSVRENGSLDRTCAELRTAGADFVLFDKVQANPTKENVEEGAAVAVREGCDFVVALGGGSVMDAAKTMAMKATNPGNLWDYAMSGTGGRKPVQNAPLPWIAISTTAGTGSEVDRNGVITNLETNEKLGMFSECAVYAIIDPELMLSVPPRFTVYQGFDTLFHVLESYICRTSNLFSDMLQETAIKHVSQWLPVAYKDGSNLEARTYMALSSVLGGYAMDTSTCTVEHSIEHAMSAYHEKLPHGAGLLMVSKAYFSKIISQHVADERFVRMAQLMGLTDADRPEDFITALEGLKEACDVTELRMSDYGIRPEEFDAMAENALTVMARLSTQDLQPLSHEEIVRILLESYK